MEHILILKNENETINLGINLANFCKQASVLYLHGSLGAGKTTLSRGFVQAFGHVGAVKSPTYNLVETYNLKNWQINHFDLYRIASPEELDFIGIEDYFHATSHNLIEWSANGIGFIPASDIDVYLEYKDNIRVAKLIANSENGRNILKQLIDNEKA